jgi:hypothetical protein
LIAVEELEVTTELMVAVVDGLQVLFTISQIMDLIIIRIILIKQEIKHAIMMEVNLRY